MIQIGWQKIVGCLGLITAFLLILYAFCVLLSTSTVFPLKCSRIGKLKVAYGFLFFGTVYILLL